MKKVYLSVLSLAMATLFLGCSDDAAPVSYLEGTPVEITTAESAESSLSSIGDINSVGSSVSMSAARAMSLAQSKAISLAPSLAPATYDCETGTMTFDFVDETHLSVVYDSCVFGTITQNGSMSISGTTLTATNYVMTDSSNGTSFAMNISMTTNADYTDTSMTGTVSFTESGDSGSLGFQNFHVVETNGNINISGGISMTSTEFPCLNGSFTISTTVDLTPDLGTGGFNAGTMVVNGATFVFNPDGTTATVTYADGTSDTVNQNQPTTVCSI